MVPSINPIIFLMVNFSFKKRILNITTITIDDILINEYNLLTLFEVFNNKYKYENTNTVYEAIAIIIQKILLFFE